MLVEILTAFCLVLVIEGILPFMSPEGYRKAVKSLSELDNERLRIYGMCSMIAGVVLLTLIR